MMARLEMAISVIREHESLSLSLSLSVCVCVRACVTEESCPS